MLLAVGLPLTIMLTGCTKESVSDCYNKFECTVKAYAEGVEVDRNTVKEVAVYVFDHEQRFLQKIDAQINEPITISYEDVLDYNIVVIGNGKQGGLIIPELSIGDPISSGIVELKSTRATSSPIYPTVDDVFWGSKVNIINEGSQSATVVIPISRIVASVDIAIKGLREYYKVYDDNYSVVVRNAKSAFDFYGRFSGVEIAHSLKGSFNTAGIYTIPKFNMFPTQPGDQIAIDIYNGTTLVSTIRAAKDGTPMVAQAGKLLNVLIDFTANVQVNEPTILWDIVRTVKTWN